MLRGYENCINIGASGNWQVTNELQKNSQQMPFRFVFCVIPNGAVFQA
jgi:hypothetical protein